MEAGLSPSPTAAVTSYGQVIEYIQSKYRRLMSYPVDYASIITRCTPADRDSQTVSTSHRTLTHPMSIPRFRIQSASASHRQSALQNHHCVLQVCNQIPKPLRLCTLLSTMIYSTTDFMPTSAPCTLDISTASLSSSTKSLEIRRMKTEPSSSGASQTLGAGRMQLVYSRVT